MFRFTIRDVLWLTALVAMGAGWWLDRANTRARLVTCEAEIQELKVAADRLTEERQILKRQLWQASNK